MKQASIARRAAALLAALAGIGQLGCENLFAREERRTGAIIVDLASSLGTKARTIQPAFSSEIDSLSVTLSSTDQDSQTQTTTSASGSVTFTGLAVATWTIGVSAIKGGSVIGSGSATVAVSSGSQSIVTVPLSFTGDPGASAGDLAIALSWPVSTGVDYLRWALDGTPSEAVIATDSDSYATKLSASGLAAGSHTLLLAFKKGGASGTPAGSYVETVGIWKGLTSGSWIDGSGTLRSVWNFATADFLDSNANLAGLALSLTIGGTAIEQDLGFSSASTSYDLGLATASSLSFSPTASLDGQYMTYSWNGGASVEIASGSSSAELDLVDGTDGINTLVIAVRAPDRTTSKEYEVVVTKGYVLSFDANGGSSVSSQTIAAGAYAAEPPTPTLAGYAFDGWYSAASGGLAWSFDTR